MRKVIGFLVLTVIFIGIGFRQAQAEWLDPNVGGDFVYDFKEHEVGGGAGSNFAGWFNETLVLRGEFSTFSEAQNKAGIGLGVNIPKVLKLTGATWISEKILPEIGVLGATDVTDFKIDLKNDSSVQGYLTVLKIGL